MAIQRDAIKREVVSTAFVSPAASSSHRLRNELAATSKLARIAAANKFAIAKLQEAAERVVIRQEASNKFKEARLESFRKLVACRARIDDERVAEIHACEDEEERARLEEMLAAARERDRTELFTIAEGLVTPMRTAPFPKPAPPNARESPLPVWKKQAWKKAEDEYGQSVVQRKAKAAHVRAMRYKVGAKLVGWRDEKDARGMAAEVAKLPPLAVHHKQRWLASDRNAELRPRVGDGATW